jgi:hypothetical protein
MVLTYPLQLEALKYLKLIDKPAIPNMAQIA